MKTTRSIAKAGPPAGPARDGEAKAPVQWSQIERAILVRIARNEYVPGQQIPTCEALAAELGANKNTVSKAYRSLAQRGFLLTRAGFGTFISRRPVRMNLDSTLDGINGLLTLAVQEAKLSGFDEAQFRKLVDDVLLQGYGQAGPRIGFIECNRHDATTLSRDLQVAIAHPIEPLLIDDVLADPKRFLADYSILAVNITHLSVVEAALGDARKSNARKAGGDAEILGMHIPIDPDSLVRVARLRAGTRVGIVCDLKQTLVSLKGMVAGYNEALVVDGCLTKERAAVRRMLQTSDLLLVTPSAAGRISLQESRVPVIPLAFRPDGRSIEHLLELIARRMPAALNYEQGSNKRRAAARAQ